MFDDSSKHLTPDSVKLDGPRQLAAERHRRLHADAVVILAAVKNDLVLIAVATGPYHAYGRDFGPGIPSGANLDLAQDMGKYVNSFHWRGDPAR